MIKYVIVGAGGFGREVYQWLLDLNDKAAIKGFLSNDKMDLKGFECDHTVIGNEESYDVKSEDRFILAIGDPSKREIVSDKIISKGGVFFTLIHPTAIVAKTAIIGQGVVVCPFALIGPYAKVLDYAVLNYYSSVSHDAFLGKYSVISPYATLNGFAHVDEKCFLGTRVSVAPKITIENNSKISAGVSIVQNIPERSFIPPAINKVFRGL